MYCRQGHSRPEVAALSRKSGLSEDLLVLNSTLTHFSRLFKLSPRRGAVSWNIIISEHFSEGNISEAIGMFQRMRREKCAQAARP
jgi:pentatricopeptide repeat protein